MEHNIGQYLHGATLETATVNSETIKRATSKIVISNSESLK